MKKENIKNFAVNGLNGSAIPSNGSVKKIINAPTPKDNKKAGNNSFSDNVHFEDTTCICVIN
ncbi:MAG: hypothetical protein MK207_12825 [Saprospiraceae bacterium]|nr:hypothetical protein [Saprospiraceae bacterium]